MKIALFSPYGTVGQEAGILYLLALFLNSEGFEIEQLGCNGIFSLCDRDEVSDWKRSLSSCLDCKSEQRNLAEWSNIAGVSLSSFLHPQEVESTRRWMLKLRVEDLCTAEFDGSRLWDLAMGTYEKRFGTRQPDLSNKQHEYFLRRLILSTARMKLLMKRYLRTAQPDLTFLADNGGFLSTVYQTQSELDKTPVARFKWSSGSRLVTISHSEVPEVYQCEILLDNVARMRRDVSSWPEELNTLLNEIVQFLGVERPQEASAVGV